MGYGINRLRHYSFLYWLVVLLAGILLLAGCEGKPLDFEPLQDGGFALNVSGSTLTGDIEATRAKAYQEATKFCRRDGRDAVVTSEAVKSDPDRGVVVVHIDFICTPKPLSR